jgi:hypothetical protein
MFSMVLFSVRLSLSRGRAGAFFAQDFVLRICEYDRRIGLMNFHRFSI